MPLRHALLAGLVLSLPAVVAARVVVPRTGSLLDAHNSETIAKPGDVIDFAADSLDYSSDEEIVTATGHVAINRDRYALTADAVVYNRTSGQVEARGNVTSTDPEGNKVYGDRLILTESLRDGAIDNILLVLADGGRLAASSAVRVNGTSTLNQAIYSPCRVEHSDGCPKQPVWAIKAVRITHDPVRHRISYRKARVEILGLPIVYLPAFSHPDGSSNRASGLLVPEVEIRNTIGFGVGIPYHVDLGPDRDVTIKPWLFTEVKPALDIRARQLFKAGPVQLHAYVTYGNVVDLAPDGVTRINRGERVRGYFETNGRLQHDSEWRSTFIARLSSDDTFDRRYGLDYDDTLRSSYNLERFRTNSYLSIAGWGFQNLRANKGPDTTPIVLPVVDYNWRPEAKLLGGQLDLTANSLNLFRIKGQDVQRGTLQGQWSRSVLTGLGQRITGTLLARGDLYYTSNRREATLPSYRGDAGFQTRGIAAAAITAEWPFAGPLLGGLQTITPKLQIVAAPLNLNRGVPNEDARSIELEDINLFAINRFSGYDRFESGTRLTYGLNYGFTRPRLAITSEIGGSVRLDGVGTSRFLYGTGLSGQFSDIVGRTTVSYANLLSVTNRFRFDSKSGNLRRNEIDLTAGSKETYLTLGYAFLNRNIVLEDLRDFQEVRAGARVAITRFWSAFGSVIVDLTTKSQEPTSTAAGYQPIRHRIGAQYEDECFRLGLSWRRDYTSDRDFRAGDSYIFTIAFKNLGR